MTRRANGGEALSFSADGRVLASASDSGSVDVWDVPTASLRETFQGHAGAANGPLFSRDGRTLYSASKDGSLIVWDVSGARRLGRPFRFNPRAVAGSGRHTPVPNASTSVAVSPDSSLFATTPGARRVTLWRSRDHSVVGELHGPLDEIDSLVFSHDGRLLVATGTCPRPSCGTSPPAGSFASSAGRRRARRASPSPRTIVWSRPRVWTGSCACTT